MEVQRCQTHHKDRAYTIRNKYYSLKIALEVQKNQRWRALAYGNGIFSYFCRHY